MILLESFLKDIPSNLKDKIVNMLNNEDALGNDWKGVAGELQLTAEQQGQVKSCSSKTSPMDELFNQMLHREYRVSNLINILKKIHRQDVIAEINAAGFKDPKEDDGNLFELYINWSQDGGGGGTEWHFEVFCLGSNKNLNPLPLCLNTKFGQKGNLTIYDG